MGQSGFAPWFTGSQDWGHALPPSYLLPSWVSSGMAGGGQLWG